MVCLGDDATDFYRKTRPQGKSPRHAKRALNGHANGEEPPSPKEVVELQQQTSTDSPIHQTRALGSTLAQNFANQHKTETKKVNIGDVHDRRFLI